MIKVTDTAIEIIFMKFQMRIRTLLGIGLKAIPVSILAKNLITYYPGPASCQKAGYKGDRLTDLSEKISNNPEFSLWHGYCWFLLAKCTVRLGSKLQSRKDLGEFTIRS